MPRCHHTGSARVLTRRIQGRNFEYFATFTGSLTSRTKFWRFKDNDLDKHVSQIWEIYASDKTTCHEHRCSFLTAVLKTPRTSYQSPLWWRSHAALQPQLPPEDSSLKETRHLNRKEKRERDLEGYGNSGLLPRIYDRIRGKGRIQGTCGYGRVKFLLRELSP